MAVTQTAISYYGFQSAKQSAPDFKEMVEHGCTTVILAVTEFDFDFRRCVIPEVVDEAHRQGLRVLIDPWGIGKFFGGEQVSLFLQNNVNHRQVSALTGEALPAACFTSQAFRDYFNHMCLTIARDCDADGFFWDEPHYRLPMHTSSFLQLSEDWSCRCPECMKKFEAYYGYEMPRFMNDDVAEFRRKEALFTLADCSRQLKELKPELEITCCIHATLHDYYNIGYRGYDDWDLIGACPYFDVFSTTIIGWDQPKKFFVDITERTIKMAKKYNKISERWIMGYYKEPEDFAKVDEVAQLYSDMGADRLAAWTFRGGVNTMVAAPHAIELWDRIGENYKRLLQK
ncbi:MAG: hypothetical protein E7045_02330 [Lentisphaerae bacterium]|nr:hypothetical protein [Lentisphaerota bacterium]